MAGRAAVEEVKPATAAGRRVDLKTKILTAFVVSTNVLGNFAMSWGMKHQAVDLGLSPLAYIKLIFTPWVLGRTAPLQAYGPRGLKDMIDNIERAWAKDWYSPEKMDS